MTMETKPFWQSKVLWVNVVAMAATYLESRNFGALSNDDVVSILAVINIILRILTRTVLVVK